MATLPFKQVDVFTDRPLFGNPVAVVIGADGLDTGTMQRIAGCGRNAAAALAAMSPDMAALAMATNAARAGGVTLFAPSGEQETAIHVRSFAPAHGIAEDPVCGSGNISVGAYLKATKQLPKFGERYVARQGMQLGRDGRVSVRISGDEIHIGGRAVTTVEGRIATS